MYYIIYKTTNTINNNIYSGKHKTENLEDGYVGSGLSLRAAIKKHGIENFKKEILHIFDTEEEMNAKEAELVSEEFVARRDTYNIAVGGQGGSFFKGRKHTPESKRKISEARSKRGNQGLVGETHPLYGKRGKDNPNFGKKHSEKTKQKISAKMSGENHPWYGKKNPEHSKRMSGENNPLYGKRGKDNPNFGRKLSEESKKNISEGKKKQPKKMCPHCSKMLDSGNYTRYHGDKCKMYAKANITASYV